MAEAAPQVGSGQHTVLREHKPSTDSPSVRLSSNREPGRQRRRDAGGRRLEHAGEGLETAVQTPPVGTLETRALQRGIMGSPDSRPARVSSRPRVV